MAIGANDKVRVGIIGTGWIAESHIESYLKMEDVEIVAAAALGSERKTERAFRRIHRIHELFSGVDHKRGLRSAEFQVFARVGVKLTVAETLFAADPGVRLTGDHGADALVVPDDIEPFAEVLAVLHRQLDHTELIHRRRRHGKAAEVLGLDEEVDEFNARYIALRISPTIIKFVIKFVIT